jgi:hypothetical protein
VLGVADEEDPAFAASGSDALVVDVGLGTGDGDFQSLPSVDEGLDSLIGTCPVAFFVGVSKQAP